MGVVVQVFDNGRGDKSFYIHEIFDAEGNYIELVDGVPTKKEISNTGEVDSSSTAGVADDGISPKNNIHNDSGIVNSESIEALDVEVDANTGNVHYSYRGVNKDGIEVYETSEEIKNLSYKDRQKRFLDIMADDYRGRTAKFIRNGHIYYATFDEKDVNKNIYGDKRSDKKGYKAKINAGADGDIFELVENAQYNGSLPEKGKKIIAHRGVGYWDYFIKNVQIDGTVFNLTANVRKKADGAFVYSIQLNENKKIKASPPLGLLSKALNGVTNASNNKIAQPAPKVNSQNSGIKSERTDESVSNRSLLANALENTVKNDMEKQKLREYREQIEHLDAEEQQLRELNGQIKELSFAKGKRDTKKISALRDEATKTANRINIYDKRLLRLEASKPLQDVLDREKKKAYKRAEEKGKEALEAYKEKATQEQKELVEKWQVSRKKGNEICNSQNSARPKTGFSQNS
ncbi:MAG: hypothetical protein IJZ68_03540 [Bacteroidaceae bacterium]|nr:hypothetical protein [Bacteroidaceae bacterium]